MKQERARLHAAAPRWDPDWQAGVAFDRLDLDAWADEYRASEGRPCAKV